MHEVVCHETFKKLHILATRNVFSRRRQGSTLKGTWLTRIATDKVCPVFLIYKCISPIASQANRGSLSNKVRIRLRSHSGIDVIRG